MNHRVIKVLKISVLVYVLFVLSCLKKETEYVLGNRLVFKEVEGFSPVNLDSVISIGMTERIKLCNHIYTECFEVNLFYDQGGRKELYFSSDLICEMLENIDERVAASHEEKYSELNYITISFSKFELYYLLEKQKELYYVSTFYVDDTNFQYIYYHKYTNSENIDSILNKAKMIYNKINIQLR